MTKNDEFSPETVEVEVTPDLRDKDADGQLSDYELVTAGPTQEQLTAVSDEEPYVDPTLLAAARGETVVTSLPLEEQGGDSFTAAQEQDTTEEV